MWKDFVLVGSSKQVKEVAINGKIAFERPSEVLIPFSNCPFPTIWICLVSYTKYSMANDYGTWTIESTNTRNSDYELKYAFDGEFYATNSTSWRSSSHSNTTTPFYVTIECPSGILIKPAQIQIQYKYMGKNSKIQGYNPNTGIWEDLCSQIYSDAGVELSTFDLNTIEYYSKFRIEAYAYATNASANTNYIYEFQVTSGTIKISN